MCHHSDRNRKDARLSWQQLITASGGWRCLYFSYQTAEGTADAPSIAAAVPACVCVCALARLCVFWWGVLPRADTHPGTCVTVLLFLPLCLCLPCLPLPLLLCCSLAENVGGQTKFLDEAESFWADLLRPNRSRLVPLVFTFILQLICQQRPFPPQFITPLVMSISN